MRLLGMVEAQLLGDREESAVVVAAGAGGVTDAAGGGDAMDCLVQQSFEGELGAAGGRGLSDQGLGRGKIGQLGVVPLNVGPRLLPARRRVQVVSCSRRDNEPECPGVPIPGHPK